MYKKRSKTKRNGMNIGIIGIILSILSLLIAILGYLYLHNHEKDFQSVIIDFYANISTELASIALTVLVIDQIARRRAGEQLKAQLIRELRSSDNGIAVRALDELYAHGWALDGSLQGVHLLATNLEGAYLYGVDFSQAWMRDANLTNAYMRDCLLHGTTLVGADLTGARELTPEQLAKASMLLGAILPNGQKYDGRYNLEKDLSIAKERGYDITNQKSMAKFYGVSVKRFIEGQKKYQEGFELMDSSIHKPDDWLEKYTKKLS